MYLCVYIFCQQYYVNKKYVSMLEKSESFEKTSTVTHRQMSENVAKPELSLVHAGVPVRMLQYQQVFLSCI